MAGAALLRRLGASVTFVVGKGGVGKTTLAGGLALALADHGTDTHLLSVDPAHSLGDLFDRRLPAGPAPSPCTDRLSLEELDAGVARDRLDRMEPALRELMDRGTYLDPEDADTLLGGTVPGLDEIGAALRIAALVDRRLVVDTAPTGHLLRLLQVPDVMRRWISVFEALAAKADAVASALLRRDVRMSAESDLEALADELAAFEAAVAAADFVVVTGAGGVVGAEARRLVHALEGRGVHVAAVVAPEPGRPEADVVLPYREGLIGCEALRAWWSHEPTPPFRSPPPRDREEREAVADPKLGEEREVTGGRRPPVDRDHFVGRALVATRQLVVFAGKGGVGKSTCAAALAVRAAGTRPVLLLSTDPAGSLQDVLAGESAPGLAVRQVEADRELQRMKALYEEEVERVFVSIGLDRSAGLDRAVVESLWRLAPPGIDEVMAMARLAEEGAGDRLVIVDGAPTGHFLRLIGMPELALDWVRRTMRILIKYGAAGELDAPARHLLRFAKRFRRLQQRLRDPDHTAVVVVGRDGPLERAETGRLLDRLEALGLPVAAILLNRAGPAVGPVRGRPTWRAPEVPEPRGVQRLETFTRAWERVP